MLHLFAENKYLFADNAFSDVHVNQCLQNLR